MIDRMDLVFISHSSSDSEIVIALVELITGALDINRSNVVCTSADGTGVDVGSEIPVSVLDRIKRSGIVIGVLSPSAMRSGWVMFELGAAWGFGKTLVPMLIGGTKVEDLPGPSVNLRAMQATSQGEVEALLTEIARRLGTEVRGGDEPRLARDKFVAIASNYSPIRSMLQNEFIFLGAPAEGIRMALTMMKQASHVLHVSLSPPIPTGNLTSEYDSEVLAMVRNTAVRFTYIANSDDVRRLKKAIALYEAGGDRTLAYLVPADAESPRMNYWVIDRNYVIIALRTPPGDDRFYGVRSEALAESMAWLTQEATRGVAPLR